VILGVDPGRDKFGFAYVREGELLFSGIAPTGALFLLRRALEEGDPALLGGYGREGSPESVQGAVDRVALGNGTGCALFAAALKGLPIRCDRTDERGTTLEARTLYRRLHPSRGLGRLCPAGFFVPPRDVDDLAAWAIALRLSRGGPVRED
jgi:RNase H-fold protein (predicted Holliday junction resolvase)